MTPQDRLGPDQNVAPAPPKCRAKACPLRAELGALYLLRILSVPGTDRLPTPLLVTRLGVSTATVKRYVEHLRMLGLTIEGGKGKRGYRLVRSQPA